MFVKYVDAGGEGSLWCAVEAGRNEKAVDVVPMERLWECPDARFLSLPAFAIDPGRRKQVAVAPEFHSRSLPF